MRFDDWMPIDGRVMACVDTGMILFSGNSAG
jgi:hypothetical protein